MDKSKKYSPELQEEPMRMVFKHERAQESQWAPIRSILGKVGSTTAMLRKCVPQVERSHRPSTHQLALELAAVRPSRGSPRRARSLSASPLQNTFYRHNGDGGSSLRLCRISGAG